VIIVGELINSSRKEVRESISNRERDKIQQLAIDQASSGANYIDINCGTLVHGERDTMQWLVETVQDAVETPLCIDTPNPEALETGLALCKNGQSMLNSITAEKERYKTVLPLVLKYRCKIVALCMDDSGMPSSAKERFPIVDRLISDLTAAGVPASDIYFDPLVKPLSTSDQAALEVLETVKYIKQQYPAVHTICGMSNVSYGLPQRRLLNQTFLVQLMALGMDGFILDPTDPRLMSQVYTSRALLGQDSFCSNYLKTYRSGLFNK
jgi:cobalamin-dependent methionine synthase I